MPLLRAYCDPEARFTRGAFLSIESPVASSSVPLRGPRRRGGFPRYHRLCMPSSFVCSYFVRLSLAYDRANVFDCVNLLPIVSSL